MVFNLIVIAIGVGVGRYLLWAYYHGQISAAALALRHREMLLLGHFTDTFVDADAEMLRANPYRASVRDLYGISHAIGRFWRIPACVFIGLLALVCMVRAAPSRFKRSFDLDGLVREQVPSFKMSAAFLGRELSLTPPADGVPLPADYALTADEWIGRFGCDANCVFYETRARRSLTAQLGPRWAGPESASPGQAALRGLRPASHRSARGRHRAARRRVGRAGIGRGQPTEPLVPAGDMIVYASKLLENPEAFGEARRVTADHAYTAPAPMSLLNVARRRHGVLAPAQFAWLKLVDRPLWYALHSLGFETEGIGRYLHPNPRLEALGARDHWGVECAAGVPIIEPDLTRAMQTLRRPARARAPAPTLPRGARGKGAGEQRGCPTTTAMRSSSFGLSGSTFGSSISMSCRRRAKVSLCCSAMVEISSLTSAGTSRADCGSPKRPGVGLSTEASELVEGERAYGQCERMYEMRPRRLHAQRADAGWSRLLPRPDVGLARLRP